MEVLIADDGLTIRRLLETYLTKWGYDVVSVSDGNAAWKELQNPDAPRLVILDWLMPGMDGVDVCRKVRQLEHGNLLYIIIFTSLEDKKDIVTALDAGADDFIIKSFDKDELQARVKVGERVARLKSELDSRVKALEESMAHIKLLQGILPICMHCHQIRDDKEVWQRLDKYIAEHTDVMLSHGLCPDCYKKHYPEFFENSEIKSYK
ncbi:MAG: response regulator transcription factor [Desulfobacteraceae bacterium]|jgi:sigma-B regulation protein RsbU (phosphoserine phosphatase)|nr:response regulator transcription factor [Desulfobacteraceae bacterium]